ncbi:hypothetical protein Tco_0363828 [Tanacetum coccineum]
MLDLGKIIQHVEITFYSNGQICDDCQETEKIDIVYYLDCLTFEAVSMRSKATSSSTRPSASTRHKGKEIAKPITPQSESVSVSDEDSDPEQAMRDKEMQKNLALLAKYFKKLYKPTNNNLQASSNSMNKTEDTTPSATVWDKSLTARDMGTMQRNAGSRAAVKLIALKGSRLKYDDETGFGSTLQLHGKISGVSRKDNPVLLVSNGTGTTSDERTDEKQPSLQRKCFNVFENEREKYHEIQDLKCSNADMTMVINELRTHSGVNHTTSVRRPQLKCYQVKDKVVANNSQVKFKKKEVEDHHRISSISKKTKSVTACNDNSKSRTLNVNAVCAECGKCVFNSNHDACVSRYLNDVNARTKKPKVVPISASKPKRKANKSVATPHKKTVALDTTIQKSKSYYKELYKNTDQEWKWWIAKTCPSGYT